MPGYSRSSKIKLPQTPADNRFLICFSILKRKIITTNTMAHYPSFQNSVEDPPQPQPQQQHPQWKQKKGYGRRVCVGLTLLVFSAFYLGRQSALTILPTATPNHRNEDEKETTAMLADVLGTRKGTTTTVSSSSSNALTQLATQARATVTDVPSARALVATLAETQPRLAPGVALAVYVGSFNPPSSAHVAIARAVSELWNGADKNKKAEAGDDAAAVAPAMPAAVWLDMTYYDANVEPRKEYGNTIIAERVDMCTLAVHDLVGVDVTAIQPHLQDPLGVEYWEVMRALVAGTATHGTGGRLGWVMGADVVAGMQYWPDKAATMLALIDDWIVVGRGDISDTAVVALAQQYLPHDPASRPIISVVRIAPEFAAVSSTKIRTDVKDLLSMTDPRVLQYVFSHNTTANGYSQLDKLYQLHTVE